MVASTDITWEVFPHARDCFAPVRERLGDGYDEDRRALQDFLCAYFNSGDCTHKHGKAQICPMGGAGDGKILKVRWGMPGCGKSGGLRIAVVAYCKTKRVCFAGAWVRKDDPTDAEFFSTVG